MKLPASLSGFMYELSTAMNMLMPKKLPPEPEYVQDFLKEKAELKRLCKKYKKEGNKVLYEETRKKFLSLELKKETE